jgi:microcompartment protein CcmK/EutM
MIVAKVIGNVVSSVKHEAYDNKKLLYVQPITPEGNPCGQAIIAVDYVGAGAGEVVLVGGAPGLAKVVFGLKVAPMKTLVMGIIERLDVEWPPEEAQLYDTEHLLNS